MTTGYKGNRSIADERFDGETYNLAEAVEAAEATLGEWGPVAVRDFVRLGFTKEEAITYGEGSGASEESLAWVEAHWEEYA